MKIAIIGYYGHNNLGDEINLYEMIKMIERQYPYCEITVFSGGLLELYYDVEYKLVLADSLGLQKYRKTLNSFDLIVIGGGGIVFLGANYFDFLLEGIKAPYIFSRVGIDDRAVSEKACDELKGIFNKAHDVTVRTSFDSKLVSKYMGIQCRAVPEAIWNYTAPKVNLIGNGNKILVSINMYAGKFAEAISKELNSIKVDNTIYTLSMQDTSKDFYYNILATPSKHTILPEAVGLKKKASFIVSSDLVITSRLHAALLAISHGIPAVMLKSTPKIEFLAKELGEEKLFYDNSPTAEDIERLLADREKIKKELLLKTADMKRLANENIIPE